MKTASVVKKRIFRRSAHVSQRIQTVVLGFARRFRINPEITENFLRSLPLWIASAFVGGVAVLYAKAFAQAEIMGSLLVRRTPWLVFFLTPACFMGAWYVVQRFAPLARGSGIPQITAALEVTGNGKQSGVSLLLGLRIVIIKILSSCLLVFGGGAIGREGPTIQISGAIFRFVGRLLPANWPAYSERVMILTGSAAGLAAAFNTPLGGIVFAIEELSKIHFSSFRTTLLTAVIISGFTAQMLLGPYLYIGFPKVAGTVFSLIAIVLATAAAGGILGAAFSQLIFVLLSLIRRAQGNLRRMVIAGMLGLGMAIIAYFISPDVLGSGKDSMVTLLFKGEESGLVLSSVRFFGPVLSFASGGAGGIFAPSLASGASLGSVIANLASLPPDQANVIILAGMVAFLTGVTRSPFTSAILVLEMTDRHSVIFFLMLSGLVSLSAAWLIDTESLYDRLKKIYLIEIGVPATKIRAGT